MLNHHPSADPVNHPSRSRGRHRGGYAHAFHAKLIADIERRARGYKHRSRRTANTPPPGQPQTKGEQIRARIALNAEKRFRIGEAMKREAGVRAHDLTGECDGGIAWTGRARILAPAGENRVQLATLAHECGHIFLHRDGTRGGYLPGHVKELEAESYAHQAFVEHGMRMPEQVTAWGRQYVGEWVAADRAAGIKIDPRAEDYAAGKRSPYEPLRDIPNTWTKHVKAARPPVAIDIEGKSVARQRRNAWIERVAVWAEPITRPRHGSLWEEVTDLLARLFWGGAYGYVGTLVGLGLYRGFIAPLPYLFPRGEQSFDWASRQEALVGALLWLTVTALWATMTRMPKVDRR